MELAGRGNCEFSRPLDESLAPADNTPQWPRLLAQLSVTMPAPTRAAPYVYRVNAVDVYSCTYSRMVTPSAFP
jgi:hypothetical protein